MKKILFAVLILLKFMPIQAQAQSLMRSEIDKFTKEIKRETKWFYIKGNVPPAMASARRHGNSIFLKFSTSLNVPFGVMEGNECLVLLAGVEKPIKLYAYYTEAASYSSHWYCHFTYELTEEQLELFLTHKITDVRLGLSDNSVVTLSNIRPGKAEKIQEALRLVMGNDFK